MLKPLKVEQVTQLISSWQPNIDSSASHVLTHLAEGCPGKALNLMENNGSALYEDLITVLNALPECDVISQHKLADRICRRGNEADFITFISLLGWWVTRMVRFVAVGKPPIEVVQGEVEIASRLFLSHNLEHWIEVWENISFLATKANSIHLDRKQVLLNVFSLLQNAARA